MIIVYLGLGSNMGDRQENLNRALSLISRRMRIDMISSVYDTEPIGFTEQRYFYNICLEAETLLEPFSLLKEIKVIEKEMGREIAMKNGPRIIDIDILFYNNIILNDEVLKIPHPEIVNRKFVLEPLCEIAGSYIHPENRKTINEILLNGHFKETVKCIGALE